MFNYIFIRSFVMVFVFLILTASFVCPKNSYAQSTTSKTLLSDDYKPAGFPGIWYKGVELGPIAPSLNGNPHFFKDWGGIQPWLTKRGIFINAGMNEEYMGNFTGGKTRDAVLAGQVVGELNIDWQRLAGAKGLWTHMLVINRHGNNIAHTLGDNVARPMQIYGLGGNVVAHLVALWADKTFFKNRLIVSGGWIPPAHMFDFDPISCSFMNVAVCGTATPNKNLPGGRTWPSGNFGLIFNYRLTTRLYIAAGAFSVTQAQYTGGISGWSWGQKQSGATARSEIGWQPSFGKNRLTGMYKLGASYDSSDYKNMYKDRNGNSFQQSGLPAKVVNGIWSSWFIFHQMLHRNGKGLNNGLILIGGAGWAQGSVSPIRDHEWLGLIMTGPAWHRPLDQAGIMFQRLNMSGSLKAQQESSLMLGRPLLSNRTGVVYGRQKWEQAYELFYSTHVMRSTAFQLDFQFLQHPGATTALKNAALMGGQFTTIF